MKRMHRRDARALRWLVGLCVLAYLPSMLMASFGGWPMRDDALFLFNHWRGYGRVSLAQGTLPLWNPHLFCGLPFLANNQSAVLYPPNLLYWFFPMAWALILDAIAHNIVLACGGYWLGRALKASRSASFLIALCLALGGAVSAHVFNGHMTWHAARAFLPWELWALLMYLRGGKLKYAALLGGFFACQCAAGYPPLVILSATLCAGLILAWMARRFRTRSPILPRGWPVALLLSITLAASLAAVYVLPLAEMSRQSAHGKAFDFHFATNFSGTWHTFARLIAPGFFGLNDDLQWSIGAVPHEEVGYIGVLPLLLAVIPFWFKQTGRAKSVWLWALLPLAGLLAMGRHTPVFGWFFAFVPPLRLTRVPVRWMELWYLAASLGAGLSFDFLFRRPRPDHARALNFLNWTLRGLCAAMLILTAVIAFSARSSFWMVDAQRFVPRPMHLGFPPPIRAQNAASLQSTALAEALLAALWAGLSAWLLGRYGQGRLAPRRLQNGLLVLVALDLLLLFWRSARLVPQAEVQARFTWPESLVRARQAQERWDTALHDTTLNAGMARNIDVYGGYDALAPTRFFQFVEPNEDGQAWAAVYQPLRRTPLLRVASISHTLEDTRFGTVPDIARLNRAHDLQLEATRKSYRLWRHVGKLAPWPRAYLSRHVLRAPESKQMALLDQLSRGDFRHQNQPVVAASHAFAAITDIPLSPRDKVLDWRQDANVLQVKTRATAPSVLVLSETNWAGWHAFVNGRATPIESANFLFRGVRVPRGEATVVCVYEPQVYRFALFVSLCGLSFASALMTRFLKFRRSTIAGKILKTTR